MPGECIQPPEAFAEIRRQSHFEPGTGTLSDTLSVVVEALSAGWELKARDLSLPQASRAVTLLAQLPVAPAEGVSVHVLPRRTELGSWASSSGGVWLLLLVENDRLSAIDINDYLTGYATETSFLVDLRGQDS